MTGKIIDRRVVPDRYEIFENDNNVKSMTFTVSKINDGVDLTDLYAFVNLESENFITNKVLLSKTITDDLIELTFNIDGAISNSDGITKAQISFESSDLSIIYSTAIFYIDVKASVDSYSNTAVTPKALFDLQSDLTKTLDSVTEKISQALEEAKKTLKFAELKIDGIVYDGSTAREVRHSVEEITELPKTIVSNHNGETDDLTLYGTYNYNSDSYDVWGPLYGNGIDSCVVKGVGDKVEDEDSPYYRKFRVRIQNSNGNYFEPLSGEEIKNGRSYVKAILDQGTVYMYSQELKSMEFEIPLKQIFKKNTYYNFKLKFKSGTVNVAKDGTPIIISLLNKTTLEEKKIYINHHCDINTPIVNNTGERFFTGEEGEICIKIYLNSEGNKAYVTGANFIVVIEESDNPCDGFPLREVTYTDIYLNEPLYCLENYDSETGQLIDALYDELDLKNSRVIRRLRKCVADYDLVFFDENAQDDFNMVINASDLYSLDYTDLRNSNLGAFRPTINIKAPKMKDIHKYMKFGTAGTYLYLSTEGFGDLDYVPPENFTFAFIYPLRHTYTENITPVKIPYRKGINCFELIGEYPAGKVRLKL